MTSRTDTAGTITYEDPETKERVLYVNPSFTREIVGLLRTSTCAAAAELRTKKR